MIRIEGVPVIAERLQKALRPAWQAGPCQGTTTAAKSARDEVSGVDIDARTFIHIFKRHASLPLGTDRA
jgi:hypothetical protein